MHIKCQDIRSFRNITSTGKRIINLPWILNKEGKKTFLETNELESGTSQQPSDIHIHAQNIHLSTKTEKKRFDQQVP